MVTSTLTSTNTPSQTDGGSLSATSVIPISTVLGVCIGAFVGAGLLICFSVWYYRRSLRRPPAQRARQQQSLAQSHGVNPATPWTRFDDGEDNWEGRNEMSQRRGPTDVTLPRGNPRPTSLFSSRKSQTTSDDHSRSEHHQALPFSHYHPRFPEPIAFEPPRPVGVENQSTTSLDGSAAGTFLSLGTVRIESGKMSPTFNVAKTTPPATSSKLHRWESAEVIDPDAQEIEVPHDPFSEKSTPTTYSPTETFGDRRSFHNPFFNAHPGVHSRRPSATRKPSNMSLSSDPFSKGEEEVMAMPTPRFISHTANESSSSGESLGNEKALQNLIAALELPQEVIEERLRVASMHPSEASRYSTTLDSPVGYAMPIPATEVQGYFVQ